MPETDDYPKLTKSIEPMVLAFLPDTVGLAQSAGESAITAAGFIIGSITEVFSDSVPKGNIISQSPTGGQLAPSGVCVNLVISLGRVVILPDIVWVSILNDSGVYGQGVVNVQMSKYETTNAQYCLFLNTAKDANQIVVYNNIVYAINDTRYSCPYYVTNGTLLPDHDVSARIHYSGGTFNVDSGFENHPVNFVSWYGATAFCNFYGYR